MIRAVLDANIFVSALIHPAGPSGQILEKFHQGSVFELILSAAILEEILRTLKYPRVRKRIPLREGEIHRWLMAIDWLFDHVSGAVQVEEVSADPDDDKYLSAAIEGRAQFLVSGDRHLLDVQFFEGIRILSPREFLDKVI